MEKIQHIETCIKNAQLNKSNLSNHILNVYGLTSYKIKHLLNNINNADNVNYLEIGVFTGSTFFAATFNNKLNSCYAIDNWSENYGLNLDTQKMFKDGCESFNIKNVKLFETDCFKMDLSNIKEKINVYFYDGAHDESSHYKALKYYYPVLDDEFIFLVDDYDAYDAKWAEVERGTNHAIKDLNLKILYEKHLYSLGRNNIDSWWNGFFVSYLKK